MQPVRTLGFVSTDCTLKRWQYEIIMRAQKLGNYSRINLYILSSSEFDSPTYSFLTTLDRTLFKYRSLFQGSLHHKLESVNDPKLDIITITNSAEITLDSDDLLVNLELNGGEYSNLACPQLYLREDNSTLPYSVVGLGKWLQGSSFVGIDIWQTDDSNSPATIVAQSHFRVYRYSWLENTIRIEDRCIQFLLDTIDALNTSTTEQQARLQVDSEAKATKTASILTLLWATGVGILRAIGRLLADLLRPLEFGLVVESLDDPQNISAKRIFLDKHEYVADPFLVRYENNLYCFAEKFDRSANKGHLVCFDLNPSSGRQGLGKTKESEIMVADSHLSYPFPLTVDGNLYLLPESQSAQKVELFHCDSFPHQWSSARILLNEVRAVDSSIHKIDGRWWLFTNIARNNQKDFSYELHVYFTDGDDLLSDPLVPHPDNPVIRDARCARNAGGLFQHGESLYRAAQGASGGYYGTDLLFREVVSISPQEYQEIPACAPFELDSLGYLGGHHFHKSDDVYYVRDVLRRRPFF